MTTTARQPLAPSTDTPAAAGRPAALVVLMLATIGLTLAAITPLVRAEPTEAPNANTDSAPTADTDAADTGRVIARVAGDPDDAVEWRDDAWRFGPMAVEAPLPKGYPQPTPPEVMEIKHYPSVRRAEISGEGGVSRGSTNGFFPLFRHIQRRDIPMTAPVEMDYAGMPTDGSAGPDEWTMSFLYRSPDEGDTGADQADPRVRIVDTEPVTVLALGVRGSMTGGTLRAALERLDRWILDSDEWTFAGDVRTFGYNGPATPRGLRWWEVQVPVKRAAATQTPPDADTEPQAESKPEPEAEPEPGPGPDQAAPPTG
jgi:hypothetical protein